MSERIEVVFVDYETSGDVHAIDLKLVCGESAATLRLSIGVDKFGYTIVQTPSPYPAEPESS